MKAEDRFFKVSLASGRSHYMHLQDLYAESYKTRHLTLCGQLAGDSNSHGEFYCQRCQRRLDRFIKRGEVQR
jgi:tRNA(Ile2) C34 agmatinyltransferase TiaS